MPRRLIRKPSLKKSIKARTTAKYKRRLKKAIIPYYGKKGTGKYKNPKKALYNSIYNRTTIDPKKIINHNKNRSSSNVSNASNTSHHIGCVTDAFIILICAFIGQMLGGEMLELT